MAQPGTAFPLLLAATPQPNPREVPAFCTSPHAQFADIFETGGHHQQPRVTTIFGGVRQSHQVNARTAGVDIIVAARRRF